MDYQVIMQIIILHLFHESVVCIHNIESKSCNTMLKSRNTMPKRSNILSKSRNTMPKRSNILLKSRNTMPKRSNILPKTQEESRFSQQESFFRNRNPVEMILHSTVFLYLLFAFHMSNIYLCHKKSVHLFNQIRCRQYTSACFQIVILIQD